jgi:hypothetical protein
MQNTRRWKKAVDTGVERGLRFARH